MPTTHLYRNEHAVSYCGRLHVKESSHPFEAEQHSTVDLNMCDECADLMIAALSTELVAS